ncbi:MAG: 16S rRNA (cytidine(1402)-2'-O)-methyltransferase, partial [Pseudomonadota bacterium]
LADSDAVAAEDTRRTRQLLSHFGLKKTLIALHDYSSDEAVDNIVERLRGGAAIALVSDAGTPLISDPGYGLVQRAIAAGIAVVPVPGPSAVTAALAVAGLPTDRFLFTGFLPARTRQRRAALEALAGRSETLVLFESVHRLGDTLSALSTALGGQRPAAVCRELTKRFETVYRGSLAELDAAWTQGDIVAKGEFVLVVAGAPPTPPDAEALQRLLEELLGTVSARDAAAIAARYLNVPRKLAYAAAQRLKQRADAAD